MGGDVHCIRSSCANELDKILLFSVWIVEALLKGENERSWVKVREKD